jgi:hypothetical protein
MAQWQGLGLEDHDYATDAPGKESGGGAHRGGRAVVGWRGAASAAAFWWRAAPAGWRRPRGRSCGSRRRRGRWLRAQHRSGTKSTARGKKSPAGGTQWRGGLRSRATRGEEWGRERGGGARARRKMAQAAGIGPRPAALPCYSGRRRDARGVDRSG